MTDTERDAEIETLQWQVKTLTRERFAHLAEIKQLHAKISQLSSSLHNRRAKIKQMQKHIDTRGNRV